MRLTAPRGLTRADDIRDFDSGEPVLDGWLKKYGWASHAGGSARCFVTNSGSRVMGYYALTNGQVARADAGSLGQGMPAFVPVQLLARLAVDRAAQGHGVGASLLQDAVLRALAVSDLTGVRALLVHAKHAEARAFYEHFGFTVFCDAHPLHLALSMNAARAFAEAFRRD